MSDNKRVRLCIARSKRDGLAEATLTEEEANGHDATTLHLANYFRMHGVIPDGPLTEELKSGAARLKKFDSIIELLHTFDKKYVFFFEDLNKLFNKMFGTVTK